MWRNFKKNQRETEGDQETKIKAKEWMELTGTIIKQNSSSSNKYKQLMSFLLLTNNKNTRIQIISFLNDLNLN